MCRRPLEKLDPLILAALRVGAVQLLILGTPVHAAVSATVEAVRSHRGSGLVNAVLRKLSREGEPSTDDAPLHEILSHPSHLTHRWTDRYGRAGAERLMLWNNGIPPLGAFLPGGSPDLQPGKYLDGYMIIPRTGSSPLQEQDPRLYIQDEATAIAAHGAARLASGGTVLDLGAAPGGKTHHLCSTADLVAAVDSSCGRMRLWNENSRRIGWKSAFPVVADGESLPFSEGFNLVFIDAPCTNTGVYRRRADARWNWSSDLLGSCVRSQRSLLCAGSDAVAPGGVLVYSTCSLEPEENHQQVEWFEEKRSDFSRIDFPAPPMLVKDGLISIFPPEHEIDGIFGAAWRRKS